MDRLHATGNPIHELLHKRWSPRAFDARPVEPDKLRSIVEAARWAPSCFNEQPWRFIIATRQDQDAFNRIVACLAEANRVWAKDAPVLMVAVAVTTFERNGKPNRHAAYDVGQASAMLSIQATALGLFVHQMGGFDPQAARQAFQLPDNAEPIAAIALGYLGNVETLPPEYRERERTPSSRRALSNLIFSDQWGVNPKWLER